MHFCGAKAPLFLHAMQKTKDHPEHFVNNLGLTQCFGQNFHHFARVLWVFAFLRWFHQNQLFFHCMLQCLIQHHMNALHHAGTQSTFFQLRLWKCQGRRQHLSCSSSGAILPASDTVSGSFGFLSPIQGIKICFCMAEKNYPIRNLCTCKIAARELTSDKPFEEDRRC